ncbi:MAG: ECF transporter S component [Oscillospiraceae bacterium]|nr:ECF transporter S component [Oscillospiraceae bacterium]
MSHTKRLVYTAILIAIGVVLPLPFAPEMGKVLLPMHLPVLLCGIICGVPYGLACGAVTPVLSHLMTGKPPMAILPSMICELAVYGLVSALLARFIKTKNTYLNTLVPLICAMLAGRVIYGAMNALVFQAGDYSMQIWMTSMFVTALPGIIIQIVLIPGVVFALQRAKLVKAYG